MQKLRSVQVLRAIAALLVVWAHASNTVPGRVGVDIFFVISGFIIGRIAQRRDHARFMLDRVWRIYPVYWVALLPWLWLAYSTRAVTFDRLLCSLTLWPVYGSHVQPYLRPAWSLTYEMLFYSAVFVAMLTGKGRWLIGAYFVCLGLYFVTSNPLIEFLGYPRVLEFLLGLWLTNKPVERAEPLFTSRAWLPVVFVGDASYSIYLVHMLVTETVKAPWPLLFVGAVALGCGFHLAVERPLLKLKPSDRVGSRKRNRAADASLAVEIGPGHTVV